MNLVTIERVETRCEETIEFLVLYPVWSRRTCLWMMMMVLHIKYFFCKGTENELKNISTRQIQQILYWCTILDSWSRTVFMTKDTEQIAQFTDSVFCRECILPRDEDSSEPKGRIRGNAQIDPVLEVIYNLLLTRQILSGNQNFVCEQGQFSHVLHNFSWVKQVGNEFEQGAGRQRARYFRSAVRRICVKIECMW